MWCDVRTCDDPPVCFLVGYGVWYSAHIEEVKDGGFDLKYADGDKEFSVPSTRIRPQQFETGDFVEVNSGGKGDWFGCTVEEVENELYKVRFKCDSIRWVTKRNITGRVDFKNNLPLCVYGLLGWRILTRDKGLVIVRRPALPPPYRGCAAPKKSTNVIIGTKQRRWLRTFWKRKSSKKQNVVVASFMMVNSSS